MATAAPSYLLDASGDFLTLAGGLGLETVELLRQTAAGGFEAAVTVRAVREEPSRKTVAGQMEAADLVWHLYGPDVGERGVLARDRIRDHSGALWAAMGVSLMGLSDQWRVPTTRVAT